MQNKPKGKNNPLFVYKVLNAAGDRTKIMLHFHTHDEPVHIRELARRTGCQINAVARELKVLVKAGYLQMKKDGIRRFYSKRNDFIFRDEYEAIFNKIVSKS